MKRIQINKNIRTGITIFLIIMVVLSGILLFKAYRVSDSIDTETVVAGYAQDSNFGYSMNIKPNQLYDATNPVGINQTYFTKITQNIDTKFAYKFYVTEGEKVDIKGNYDITAILNTDLWEKKFIIVPRKEFSGTGNIEFTESFPVDINKYNEILTSISNEIGVQPKESKLKLVYDINAIVTKDEIQNIEKFNPIIVITSTKGSFNVIGDTTKTSENVIKKIVNEPALDVLAQRVTLSIIVSVLVLITIIFFGITKNRIEDSIDATEKEIIDIKKKYGDIIIEAKVAGDTKEDNIVILGNIEDLVKVASEVEEPVIHKYEESEERYIYYVYDGYTRYEYSIDYKKINK